jgi:hypothetical protein
MYRLKHIYPQAILLTLYNTLIVPHFTYCLLVWGFRIIDDHPIHLLQKKALRNITNSEYIAHTEPICRELRLVKVPDMFGLSIWKFYFKLMNNKLPEYFNYMKPELPRVIDFHNIRRPTFHLPNIRHAFAEQLVHYQMIKLLNTEKNANIIMPKVYTHSFCGYKLYIKNVTINSYMIECTNRACESCRLLADRLRPIL